MSPVTRSVPDAELAARLRLAVTRLARRLRQQAQQVQGEVTPSGLSALASIERLGPLTLGELSHVERVQPPTMTKVVAGLEALGLVTRTIDPSDRRVARVAVTADGGRFLARSRTRKNAWLAARFGRLDPEERAVLDRAAAIFERLLEDDSR